MTWSLRESRAIPRPTRYTRLYAAERLRAGKNDMAFLVVSPQQLKFLKANKQRQLARLLPRFVAVSLYIYGEADEGKQGRRDAYEVTKK